MTELPELLAPAGSPDSLAAAIEGGADAVYFGADRFSARARAVNFTENEIADALALARAHGVKAYAAVNTRVRENELADALSLVRSLYLAGCDALIVADLGLVREIRQHFPSFELHASTQLTAENLCDAHALSSLGFSRMVAPRELSIGDIGTLCEKSPIDIEIFVHGAHCVSLSGQCLMSSLIGGRSANRGECAQPCRLPWKCKKAEGYLLSLADMCYAPDVPEIIASGARSLKIEGRQKSADYVFGVVKTWRRLLDENRRATEDEISYMASLFTRGFTDGYLRSDFKKMTGVREGDAESAKSFAGLKKKVPASAKLTLRAGEKAALSLSCASLGTANSLGDVCAASDTPLTEQRARESVAKLGSTPFSLNEFEFVSDNASWLSASSVNSLRRSAAQMLLAPPTRAAENCGNITSPSFPEVKFLRTAEFLSSENVPASAHDYFDIIFLPYPELANGYGVSLPPYMTDMYAARVQRDIPKGTHVLCHTLGQIAFASQNGYIPHASFRLNIYNDGCAFAVFSLGAVSAAVSPELTVGALRALRAPLSSVIYGYLPAMFTVRCMMNAGGGCKGGVGGFTGELRESGICRAHLIDRRKTEFFVCGMRDCTNVIVNSVPIWCADRADTRKSVTRGGEHFIFTKESALEAASVIEAYKRTLAPDFPVRRIK